MPDARPLRLAVGLAIALSLLVPIGVLAKEESPAASPGVTAAVVRGYLEKMGGTCRAVGRDELRSEARAGGKTWPILVKVDPARFLVYLALDDFFPLAAKDPARSRVTDRMAALNYELAVGKLEWDARAGQVRLSHSFSTEDGLGYRSFAGVLATLLQEAGPTRKALEEAKAP